MVMMIAGMVTVLLAPCSASCSGNQLVGKAGFPGPGPQPWHHSRYTQLNVTAVSGMMNHRVMILGLLAGSLFFSPSAGPGHSDPRQPRE